MIKFCCWLAMCILTFATVARAAPDPGWRTPQALTSFAQAFEREAREVQLQIARRETSPSAATAAFVGQFDRLIATAGTLGRGESQFSADPQGRSAWRSQWWEGIQAMQHGLDGWERILKADPKADDALKKLRLIEAVLLDGATRGLEHFQGGHKSVFHRMQGAIDPDAALALASRTYGNDEDFWPVYAREAAFPADIMVRIDNGPGMRASLRHPAGQRFAELSDGELLQARDALLRFGVLWRGASYDQVKHPFGKPFVARYDGLYDDFIERQVIPAFLVLSSNLRYRMEQASSPQARARIHRWVYTNFFDAQGCYGQGLARACPRDLSMYDLWNGSAKTGPRYRSIQARLESAHQAYLLEVSKTYVQTRRPDAVKAALVYAKTLRVPKGQNFDGWVTEVLAAKQDSRIGWAPRGMLTPRIQQIDRKFAEAQRRRIAARREDERALMLVGGVIVAGFVFAAMSPDGTGFAEKPRSTLTDYYFKPVHPWGYTEYDLMWKRKLPSARPGY